MSSQKMGFWRVTSLVTGSQIGSGIFLLPISLVAFGAAGVASWFVSGSGAMMLALVFARLCGHIPKTGGPHTFIESAFGEKLGFFSAWTYWVISWLSTSLVVVATVAYLSPFLGNPAPIVNLSLQLFIILIVTYLNLLGTRSPAWVELLLTVLKLLPIFLIPIAGIFFFNKSHFFPFNPTSDSTIHVVNAAALLTFWGFIGVESATTPADAVENPQKTIPKAIVFGTFMVTIVYIFSSTIIMGVVSPQSLAISKAPFADAAQIIFGGNFYLLVSVTAAVVCFGNLKSWVLTSSQIALGAAADGHLPQIFAIKNAKGVPKWGIIISSIGMCPVLILAMNQSLVALVNFIIDISVTAFLFIYLLSVLSYLKIFWRNQVSGKIAKLTFLIGFSALIFCVWILYSSGIQVIACASIIVFAGVPVYLWKTKRGFAKV